MILTKRIFKILIWFVFLVSSVLGIIRVIKNFNPISLTVESEKLINAFYWSGLMVIEIILAVLVVYYFVKKPSRRTRLITLSVCHFTVILLLPLTSHDWAYTAIFYSWPHTLQAFDASTSKTIMWMSLFAGCCMIPFFSYKWGRKSFCGYICPHGAFISETYGRIFRQHPGRLIWLSKFIPPVYFFLMTVALLSILILPESTELIRNIQKIVFLMTAELLYFVILVPFIGGRSYCNLICPLGYAIRQIASLQNNGKKSSGQSF